MNIYNELTLPYERKYPQLQSGHIQHIRASISLLIPDVELIVPTSTLTCYHTGGTLTEDNGISRSDRAETKTNIQTR